MPPPSDTNNLTDVNQMPVPLSWLGDMLIASRKEQGITQIELGERLGLHQAAVARMETAKYRSTSLERLLRVAEALDLSLRVVPADATPAS